MLEGWLEGRGVCAGERRRGCCAVELRMMARDRAKLLDHHVERYLGILRYAFERDVNVPIPGRPAKPTLANEVINRVEADP